jgi:hypothetical protein
MLDSFSSRTMDLEYLGMDPHLREDDLDLLVEFENCCRSNRDIDASIAKKISKKMDKSYTFARIMCKIKSQYPFSKYSSSSKSYHDSSKYPSHFSSSKSYENSSKYPSHFSSSKSYHDSSKYHSNSSSYKAYDDSSKYHSNSSSSKPYHDFSKYHSQSSYSKPYHDSSKYHSSKSSPTSSSRYHSSSTSTKSLIPLIEIDHNEQHEKPCDKPIYNAYCDNDYDDDDYYTPTHPKSPSSPMFVLKGDESQKDTDGNPQDSNLENNIDKFCEQYLNDKSAFFDEEKAFFCAEIQHQWDKSSSSKNPHDENKDYTLEQDHVNVEPLSSDSPIPSSTSSTIHTSLKDYESLKSSTNHSSNKNLDNFHAVPYSYPQGLSLKETQANLHLATNTSNNAKSKEPKPSCTIMPTSASPSQSPPKSSIQFQHSSLSLEVGSCQEVSKNDKEKNIKKDQDQEPSMPSNPFHDIFDTFHGSFDPLRHSSFIPPCLKSSPKQDQAITYTAELIENKSDLNIVAPSKDDTCIKVIKNSVDTSSVEPIENQEKNSTLMLSKDPCQDQSVSSSYSTTSCFHPLSTLPKSSQALSAPIKEVAPIQDVHIPIDNVDAHSKDADILDCHIDVDKPIDYPFASSTSILGPTPPIPNASHLPSILGPYVPSTSPQNSPNSSSILGPYVPPSPIFPQDQRRYISLNTFHPPTYLNQSYHPSSTIPKSSGSNLNVQYKKKKKFKNPYKKEDHHVSSNRHGGIKSKEICKKKIIRQVWVPKPIIEDIISKSSKRNEKKPMAIWIPKSLLRESNVEQQLKLTFKLPKTSTSSSSKRILPFHVPKPQPLLSTHHIPSRIPSFMFSPSSHHPSRHVLTLILPSFPYSNLTCFA